MKLSKHIAAAALVALVLAPSLRAAQGRPQPSDKIADRVVAKYAAAPAAEVANQLRADLTAVKVKQDPAKVEERLREQFGDFVLQDPNFTRHVFDVIEPAFKFAGKERLYRLLILKTRDPIAFVEDNCVVVISTGLLMAANSEDALVGVVAHEQAHGLFAERAASARRQLEVAQQQGNAALEAQALASINFIEYECDAVAALQLSASGYNPLRYVELLEAAGLGVRIDAARGVYVFEPSAKSPEHARRIQVVTRLTTPEAAKVAFPTNRLLPLQAGIRQARGER